MSVKFALRTPYFSLVVATLGRADELKNLLDSLLKSSEKDFEIIVVDQNKDERLVPIIQAHQKLLPLTYIRTEMVGANKARNLGALRATGEWLTFPDDDCQYKENTLSAARTVIVKQQPLGFSGVFTDSNGVSSNAKSAYQKAKRRSRYSFLGSVHESTMFVRQDIFSQLGGFDEEFGPGTTFPSTEGIELFVRILKAYPRQWLYFSTEVSIQHPIAIPPWDSQAAKRLYSHGIGTGAFLAKHPNFPFGFEYLLGFIKVCLVVMLTKGWKREGHLKWLQGIVKGFRAYRTQRQRAIS